MTTDILRENFLNFFKFKKHKIVDSDSLVPGDDPTVLFTPAGMNQFKKEFLGYDSGFKRAATAQRCLRTDDLEKVGRTSVHHTFFEMLGNFSFGDYFKKEAIGWAWEFLTKELKIREDRLWVSVYKEDEEAYTIWKELIKLPESKILKLGDKDNFWPSEARTKGPNGPCGPCSEIFFDFGKQASCSNPDCDPTCSCGRFAEIWNLVFTQFNRKDGGVLESLPQKNIDTGMGLERLTAVMEGVANNFDTTLFQPIVKEIGSKASAANPQREDIYATADHIRAITFCLYDGVLPSNESRGYIVRKLIRKSTLHLRDLGFKHPFLYKLLPYVTEVMRGYYPQLGQIKENIAQLILAEEKNFINTLETSKSLFKEKFSSLIDNNDPRKAGVIAFELHDTYGIPFELTRDWLNKNNIAFSEDTFNKSLQEQKYRSKQRSAIKGGVFDIKELTLGVKGTKFLGYKGYADKAKILRIIAGKGEIKKIDKNTGTVEIVLDQTPFYGESGGQVGDIGQIIKGKNIFQVIDTKKIDKVIAHIGKVGAGSFKKGDLVRAAVDSGRRLAIARNHTATHLLQAALRKILGKHVQQQGSLVAEDRFRFDFTHFKGLDKEQLDRVEEQVNNYIISNFPVSSKEMTLAQAKKTGALAFFGEKYEGKVRVVSVSDISKELCGGTHLEATGQIGLFKILQEGSVASGVRRIEACTGEAAYRVVKDQLDALSDISALLNVPKENVASEVQARLNRIKTLEKEINSQKLEAAKTSLDELLQTTQDYGDKKLIAKYLEGLDMNLLRKNVDLLKQKISKAVIALGSGSEGKAFLVIGVTDDLCQEGLDAAALIKDAAKHIGGSGGGRKDFAQAGGNKPENFPAAFQELKNLLAKT